MEREVFADDDVAAFFNEHFINLRIDMESEDGIPVSEKYSVEAYPTFLFIDGTISLTKEMDEKYNKGERSVDFIYKYIKELKSVEAEYERIGQNYLDSLPYYDSIYSNQDDFVIFYLSENRLNSKATNYFTSHLTDFYFTYPASFTKDKLTNLIENNILILKTDGLLQNERESILAFCRRTLPKDQVKFYSDYMASE